MIHDDLIMAGLAIVAIAVYALAWATDSLSLGLLALAIILGACSLMIK